MLHKFTWDDPKNEKNIRKHSLELKAGISVFEDKWRVEIFDEENSTKYEDRYITIGKDDRTNVLFVCYTTQDKKKDNTIHLISVRKAESPERQVYIQNLRW